MSKRQRTESEINDDYFKDYNNTTVHRLMLGDQARIRAYADAIQTNLHLFKNKIILDVGSGSGILALLAARAGAKKVYAVEASDMALTIRLTALENNLSDIVQVMHQKMEDVVLPEKVDIIISEWMAIFLVQEGMLPSVLNARDKWLKEDGHLFPSTAKLYVQPADLSVRRQQELSFWNNIEGLSFGSLKQRNYESMMNGPKRLTVQPNELCGDPVLLWSFNVKDVDPSALLKIEKKDVVLHCQRPFSDLVFWFETGFPCTEDGSENGSNGTDEKDQILLPIVLSTSPNNVPTHWQQGVLHLENKMGPENETFSTPELIVSMTLSEVSSRYYVVGVEAAP